MDEPTRYAVKHIDEDGIEDFYLFDAIADLVKFVRKSALANTEIIVCGTTDSNARYDAADRIVKNRFPSI